MTNLLSSEQNAHSTTTRIPKESQPILRQPKWRNVRNDGRGCNTSYNRRHKPKRYCVLKVFYLVYCAVVLRYSVFHYVHFQS